MLPVRAIISRLLNSLQRFFIMQEPMQLIAIPTDMRRFFTDRSGAG
jgi:hypothetical protein